MHTAYAVSAQIQRPRADVFAYLTDLRNELMIIYCEVLDATGYRLSDVAEGGPAATEWATLSQALQ